MVRIFQEIASLQMKGRKVLHDSFVAESNVGSYAAQQVDSELASGGPARQSYPNVLF